ncbi:MAG: hypothetical protein ACPGVA_13725 [Pikeienuella sp.]
MKHMFLKAFAFGLIALATTPPLPSYADETSAREMLIGQWACARKGVSVTFIYNEDGTGRQGSHNLRYEKNGLLVEMDLNMRIKWSLETNDDKSLRIRHERTSMDIDIHKAEYRGSDPAENRQILERLKDKLTNPSPRGHFDIAKLTRETLILKTRKGQNNCQSMPSS